MAREDLHDAQVVGVELVETELRDDEDARHPRAEAQRDGQDRLLDESRARDLLAELAVRRVADEQRLARLSDPAGDPAPDVRRADRDLRAGLGGGEVPPEGDRLELLALADEDTAVVVVDQEPELVGDRQPDLRDAVQARELPGQALQHLQMGDRADVVAPRVLLGRSLRRCVVEDDDEAVPARLRGHHRRLRARDQLARVGRVLRAHRHSGGHGQPARRLDLEQLDAPTEPLGEAERALEVTRGDDDRELLAADPTDDVRRADGRAEDVRDVQEQLVADAVPVDVVHLLEVVQVDHHERDGVVLDRRPHELLAETVVEGAVVVEAGQCVGRGLMLEARAHVGVVDRERGGVAEAGREQELLLRELLLLADPVDVERPLETPARDQGNGDERLGVDRRSRHEADARIEVCLVREDRLAVLDRPAGDALAERERLAHDLVLPLAPSQDGNELALRLVRLVDVDVLVRDEDGERVGDPLEERVEALLGEHVVEDLRESSVRLDGRLAAGHGKGRPDTGGAEACGRGSRRLDGRRVRHDEERLP